MTEMPATTYQQNATGTNPVADRSTGRRPARGRRVVHHVRMDVNETLLPGIGIRYEFAIEFGIRVGLIVRRDGRVELVVYDTADPDVCTEVMSLTPTEAATLADLLGAPRIAERFADLTREIPGLMAARLEVPEGSRYAGRTLGDTRARTLTGASIVAVVRRDSVVTSPLPTQQFQAGDVLVVIGAQDAIDKVRQILAQPAG